MSASWLTTDCCGRSVLATDQVQGGPFFSGARDPAPDGIAMVRLGSVFVEALASRVGDCEAGWFLHHAPHRAVVDESVERIGQSPVVQAEVRDCWTPPLAAAPG